MTLENLPSIRSFKYLLPSSYNKGVIETRTDVDFFFIDVAAGELSIKVQPAWAAFYRDSLRGANLDIAATLYDLSGQVVASSDPLDNTDANIFITVAAGSYYLAIRGVGSAVSPYPDYGSLGQYFITGSVPVMVSNPPVAPAALTATALAYDHIYLTWNDQAVDELGCRLERPVDQVSWSEVAALSANSTQ